MKADAGTGAKPETAVVLFNLGGPDGPGSIRPFLFNFFMDRNIIRLPLPLRWLIARAISRRRSRREAAASYGLLGGKSPLLENTRAQAEALEKALGPGYAVVVCMRYWHPMTPAAVREVAALAPRRVVLLPLYPQYSTTTTRSSFQQWKRHAAAEWLAAPTFSVCCYPEMEGFVKAAVRSIKAAGAELARQEGPGRDAGAPRLLFSAHGLPESVIADGDPYQAQCERTARAIAEALEADGGPGIVRDWRLCYQSRVGPKKWIGPSTEEELEKAAADKAPVIVYPLAFVNEHVETLAEIEIEYRHRAAELGVPGFARAAAAGTDPDFIEGLARLVRDAEAGKAQPPACPAGLRRCCRAERPAG